MRRSRFVLIMLIFTCSSCEIDKFKLGDCNGDDCIGASGYLYDRLTDEPLVGASIKITYKENVDSVVRDVLLLMIRNL